MSFLLDWKTYRKTAAFIPWCWSHRVGTCASDTAKSNDYKTEADSSKMQWHWWHAGMPGIYAELVPSAKVEQFLL